MFFCSIFFNWEGGLLYFLLLLVPLFTLLSESSILSKIVLFFFNLLCMGILFSSSWLIFFLCYEILSYLLIFYLLLGGSQSEKVLSAYFFLFYSFSSSFLFLFCILLSGLEYNETIMLFSSEISLIFFLFFCVKIPVYFFHGWLPKVHVESSTLGSVCLAALILKMAFFGLLLALYLCSSLILFFFILMLLVSLPLSSFSVISQSDGKSFVAFSSVVHMSFFSLLLMSSSMFGMMSSVWGSYSHGAISGILFFVIGSILMGHGSRLLYSHSYYGGTVFFVFFLFWFFNSGLPPSVGFLSELLGISVIFYLSLFCFFMVFLYFFLSIYISILYGLSTLVGSWSVEDSLYLTESVFFLLFFLLGIFLII